VKLLLDKEQILVNLSTHNKGRTALINASSLGHTDIVNELLRNSKIDVNICNKKGHTALFKAADKHRMEVESFFVLFC
jgi:ankyrin repeat protein